MADDGDEDFYDGGDDDYDGYEEEGDSEGFVVSDDDDDGSIAAAAARDEADVKVITKESLLAAQRADLQRVMDLLSLREHHARTLLIHFRWDVHKLISVFVENGADRLYSLVGIVLPKDFPSSVSSDISMVGCQICFEEKTSSEVAMMDCGHYFCKGCWAEYFIVQIQEGLSKRIRCMACKCNAICDEEKIRDLVSFNHSIAKKFENSLLESYIEDNDKVKWCPSIPHCGNAISVESDGVCEVKCTCGLEFCFGCLSEAHSPCSCFMWRLWVKKCSDDSETSKWVTANTKPCPKCFKPVAKDGGCNHVTCVCGQSMCWLCGGPTGQSHTYESIEGHSCGRYKKEDGEQKNTERARRRLWRYTHYFSHYTAHKDSLKLESAKEKIMHRISKLEDLEYESRDYSWLLDGFNRLSRARRILAYSYPFAYYMFGDELFAKEMTESDKTIKQELFESQQQQFAGMVEKLSQALEEKIDDKPTEDKIKQVRRTVLDLSLLTDGLCKKMYSCIENDLLGPLSTGTLHQIAAYQSKGVKKASEFGISFQAIST